MKKLIFGCSAGMRRALLVLAVSTALASLSSLGVLLHVQWREVHAALPVSFTITDRSIWIDDGQSLTHYHRVAYKDYERGVYFARSSFKQQAIPRTETYVVTATF